MIKFIAFAGFFLLKIFFADAQTGFAVVELFTSEGCSSCPPAEKVLDDLAKDAVVNHKTVFCLEYHVDYWNHSGWKDPFSKNQFTMRQTNYSGALHQQELYTPQMIVNGETEFTGSDAGKAAAVINKALEAPSKISLDVETDTLANDSVVVRYAASATDKNFSIHFAMVENHLISEIRRGENSGKTLTHDHVVRIFYSTAMPEKNGSVKIPLNGLKINSNCSLITFIQHKQTMKIMSAAETKLIF